MSDTNNSYDKEFYRISAGIPGVCGGHTGTYVVGIYIYDIGILIWLWSWWPLLVFLAQVILLTLQVRSEEKRLEKDFGDEYRAYKSRVPRYVIM